MRQFPREVYDVQDYPIRCIRCKAHFVLKLDPAKVQAWKDGAHVQVVFPELTPGERELLISGTCDKCFDAMFE